MSTQKGTVAVVWSVGVGATATGMGTFTTQSAEYQLGGDQKKLRGADGVTVNRTFFDREETVTMEVVPTAPNLAAAKAANKLPARGADVVVTNTNESGANEFVGTYIFRSGTKRETVDGEMRFTFVMSRFENVLATRV